MERSRQDGRRGKEGKGKGRGDKRTGGKLRKARRGEGQYKAYKETSAVIKEQKVTKDWDESRKKEKGRKKTHIGIIQWIREQDCVPRSGGLVGLVLGDGFGAVKVVFLGYDG